MPNVNSTVPVKVEQSRSDFGHWLAGFVAGEGYFTCEVENKSGRGRLRCRFGICLRDDDQQILRDIRDYLGCGSVRLYPKYDGSTSNPTAKFSIADADDLLTVVSPLFTTYPLRAKKNRDFSAWSAALNVLHAAKSRTVYWRLSGGYSDKQKWRDDEIAEFLRLSAEAELLRGYVEPVESPVQPVTDRVAFGHWLAGFIDAEGCFDLQTFMQKGCWCATTSLRLKIRYDDLPILKTIRDYLGCGSIKRIPADGRNNPRGHFLITGADNLLKFVIPVLDQFPLRAKKLRDYHIWKDGVSMIASIKSRPRVFRGKFGRGYLPKWTDSERRRFSELCQELKDTRKYIEGGRG